MRFSAISFQSILTGQGCYCTATIEVSPLATKVLTNLDWIIGTCQLKDALKVFRLKHNSEILQYNIDTQNKEKEVGLTKSGPGWRSGWNRYSWKIILNFACLVWYRWFEWSLVYAPFPVYVLTQKWDCHRQANTGAALNRRVSMELCGFFLIKKLRQKMNRKWAEACNLRLGFVVLVVYGSVQGGLLRLYMLSVDEKLCVHRTLVQCHWLNQSLDFGLYLW